MRTSSFLTLLACCLSALASACLELPPIDKVGKSCTNETDCAGRPGDRCLDIGTGRGSFCVPARYLVDEDLPDGGPNDAGVDAGPQGPVACSSSADCAESQGCAPTSIGLFCKNADATGIRVEGGQLNAVPHFTGRTTSGVILRQGSLAPKPWITGTTAGGVTVMGGDFR